MANKAICQADELADKYLSLPDINQQDEEVDKLFDTVAIRIFERFLKRELETNKQENIL